MHGPVVVMPLSAVSTSIIWASTQADGAEGLGLLEQAFDASKDWLTAHGPGLVFKIVGFLVILFVFRYVARFTGRVATRAVASSRLNVTDLLRNFFVNVVTKGTFLIGLMIALSFIGINMGPLLASLGVFGIVIGFALKDTLNNFACGVMILLYRPYDLGDYITAGGVSGTVKSMSLVSSTLVTGDNQVMIVPNGSIWGNVIINPNANDTRRVDLSIGIGYDDDIEKTQQVLEEIVTSHPLVLEEPAPTIRLTELDESCVRFIVRPWTKSSDRWGVTCDLAKSIKLRFDEQGISLPYPQHDIHIVSGQAT